jgi:transcriptional regulator with XRE-family HTH domain
MSAVIVPEIRAVDCRALKPLYRKMGLSGRAVARLVHVHPSAVSRWCSGERNPSLLQLLRLTTKLGVVAWQIWTTYEETEPAKPPAQIRPRSGDRPRSGTSDQSKSPTTTGKAGSSPAAA